MSPNKDIILVTGGGGHVGRQLCSYLASRGFKVRLLLLEKEGIPQFIDQINEQKSCIDCVFGDITKSASLRNAFKNVKIVVHMAAIILSPKDRTLFHKINLIGTQNIVDLCIENKIEQLVYISSTSVNYRVTNAYSHSKRMAEKYITQKMPDTYTIIRPTLVYCATGGDEFMRFVSYLKKMPIVFLIGNGTARKKPILLDDLVHGIASVIWQPVALKKVYELAGANSISLRNMAIEILKKTGKSTVIIPIPLWICKIMATVIGRFGLINPYFAHFNWQTITGFSENAEPDISLAVRDLGFNPRSFEVGLQEITL